MGGTNEYHFIGTGNMVSGAAARKAGGVNDLPTVGSLFAGIGGIDLAFEAAGFRTVWQVEIADFPRAVLAKHFPRATQHRDIFDCHKLPHVDVITAGFPCQPFSLAGKRMGVKDERYLIPEMLRVIQEVQPHVVFLENVPGFASIADGDTFKQLLRALAEMGYDAQWGHLRASDAGAPHQRERWFCVAYASQLRFSPRWPEQPLQGVRPCRSAWPNGIMVNARRQRRQKRHAATVSIHKEYLARRHDALENTINKRSRFRKTSKIALEIQHTGYNHQQHRFSGANTGQPQSRLGGNAHGLPDWLDRHQFPAPPGQPQHAAEPPRVTTATPNRNARLKALGNAVVPQVIYPVALAIAEWLVDAVQEVAA